MQQISVGVLMGGRSCEAEVSFNSGRTVCDHLDSSNYQIIPLFQDYNGIIYILPWQFLHRGKITDFIHRLPNEAVIISWDELAEKIDFMYIAMHGCYAEDGILQGTLELLNIPYLGSSILASAVGMDKSMQKKFLTMHGIETPRGITCPIKLINRLITQSNALQFLQDSDNSTLTQDLACEEIQQLLNNANLMYPLIVKPNNEGSSLGITLVHNHAELFDALYKAATVHKGIIQPVVIEEYLLGMEFTAIILTDHITGEPIPLAITEIVSSKSVGFFDYEQKYMPGKAVKFMPARCNEEMTKKIQTTALQVMQCLNIKTTARIDGIVTPEDKVIIFDPNNLSGMDPASFLFRAAAERNMSHTDVINHLIETELMSRGIMSSLISNKTDITSKSATPRLRIGVLLGGASNEREISLESGRNICYKLSPTLYEVLPLFVTKTNKLYQISQSLLVRNSTKEIAELLEPAMQWKWHDLKERVDFIFIGLHGGLGENGGVQGILEMLDIPYNGSGVLTSALCMDKYKTNQLLRYEGFDVPDHLLVEKKLIEQDLLTQVTLIEQIFSYPFIVKPHDDGCSVMVALVKSRDELTKSLAEIFQEKSVALIEERIVGIELTVGVIGNEHAIALPPSQVVTKAEILSIEEKFLPGAGENQTPALLNPLALSLVQKTITEVYKAVGCKGYARIDCFYQTAQENKTGKERVIILEINTLPGLTPATCIFHQAAEIGMKPMDFITTIVQYGLEEHKRKLVDKIEKTIMIESTTNSSEQFL